MLWEKLGGVGPLVVLSQCIVDLNMYVYALYFIARVYVSPHALLNTVCRVTCIELAVEVSACSAVQHHTTGCSKGRTVSDGMCHTSVWMPWGCLAEGSL